MSKPHKHAELIKAWADGAEIEYLSLQGSWVMLKNPSWNTSRQYRIKKEQVFVPYSTLDQCKSILGKHVYSKDSIGMITGIFKGVNHKNEPTLYFYTGDSSESINAEQLLASYKFADGSPCGILK